MTSVVDISTMTVYLFTGAAVAHDQRLPAGGSFLPVAAASRDSCTYEYSKQNDMCIPTKYACFTEHAQY